MIIELIKTRRDFFFLLAYNAYLIAESKEFKLGSMTKACKIVLKYLDGVSAKELLPYVSNIKSCKGLNNNSFKASKKFYILVDSLDGVTLSEMDNIIKKIIKKGGKYEC